MAQSEHDSGAGPAAGIAERIDAARYRAAIIPTILMAILADHGRACGHDPDAWFDGTGLSAAQSHEPNQHVSYRQAMTIIRRALRAFGDVGLGLAVGGRESLSSFGMLGFAMMSSRTFGDAVAVGLEYHQISGSLLDVHMQRSGGAVALVARERFPEAELLPFLCEEAFASMSNVSRAMLGARHRLLRAEFAYPAPRYVHAYEAAFDCPLRFGAAANRMWFDAGLLDEPLATYNPISLAEALRACRAQAASVTTATEMLASLERWLRPRLGRNPGAAEAARALHMTERTLRRRLAGEGTSFRALHDLLRAERARQLLADPLRSIAEVGAELGYSDGREFRRAFKRWTGLTPRELRGTAGPAETA
ncbi:MAG: AraC family transcriptional regulator [Nevskiales bacterium]|nr:AraC family transcriptional regulator [Nevskiales bacterium]